MAHRHFRWCAMFGHTWDVRSGSLREEAELLLNLFNLLFDSCFRAEYHTWKWSRFLEGLSREHVWGWAQRGALSSTPVFRRTYLIEWLEALHLSCVHTRVFLECALCHLTALSALLLCPSGPSERFQFSSLTGLWPVRTPLPPQSLDFLILKGTRSPGKPMGELVITISLSQWIQVACGFSITGVFYPSKQPHSI